MERPAAQLRKAGGLAHLDHLADYDTDCKTDHGPFSTDEFAKEAGHHVSEELARTYDLPHRWTYADLRESAGPEQAMVLVRQYGFSKSDSHQDLEKAIGKSRAAQFAKSFQLPVDFTAEQLVQNEGQYKIKGLRIEYSDSTGEVNEAWIAAHEAIANHEILHQRYPGLADHFSENDLAIAAGAEECSRLRNQFGLEPGFTESDLSTAVAESKVADIRTNYHLRREFTAEDLRKGEQSAVAQYNFGHCGEH